MKVERIRFLGVRTDRFPETAHIFRDVLNLPLMREADGLLGFRLPDGTTVELYGPGDEFHDFLTTGPVVGLVVDDFDAARRELADAGIEFIGDPQHEAGTSWNHFRLPDGTVMEIIGPGRPRPE